MVAVVVVAVVLVGFVHNCLHVALLSEDCHLDVGGEA